MIQHAFGRLFSVTLGPEELFKVERNHVIVELIPHADTLYSVVMDAEQRPAADHVVAPILAKGFQRRRDLRKLLQLVKEDQRLPGEKLLGGVKQRDVFYDALHIIAFLGDRLIFRFQRKVDLYDAFVSPLGEAPDRLRFSDLPRAFHDQRLPLRVSFPRGQIGVDLSSQIHTAPPHTLAAIIINLRRLLGQAKKHEIQASFSEFITKS